MKKVYLFKKHHDSIGKYWYRSYEITTVGGPDDVIMQLVSIAEYCSTDWRATINVVDNLHDGKGMVIGLLGFSTANGEFLDLCEYLEKIDPYHVLIQFIPSLRRVMNSDQKDSTRGLERIPSVLKRIVGRLNKNFWRASFRVLMKHYWYPALMWCNQKGLTSKLARYIIYDTMVQFGQLRWFEDVEWNGVNEGVYLKNFLEKRQQLIEDDERLGKEEC